MTGDINSQHRTENAASLTDWFYFALIVLIGGAAFAMIKVSVETIPPAIVTIARLWIGAIFLYAVMRQAGRKFPPLIHNGALHLEWRWMIAISLVGYVAPFFIFPWAQQYIESGLAGVYMAFMPIWTVTLAYFFANESLGPKKIIGVVLGFIGVMVLLGPDVFKGAAQSNIMAQVSLLAATLGYAAAAVMTRRAPPIRPRVFSAGSLISAAILSTPVLFFTDFQMQQWTWAGVVSLIGLGLGPTGLAGLLLIIIIQRVGAGFMGFSNYITPVWAVILGAFLFHERLDATVFIALAIILAGVAISQRRDKPSRDKP